MAEPQLSVRSAKARDLAHRLARREQRSIADIVERALESVSPIALRFEVPQPTWHGHYQAFYRLRAVPRLRKRPSTSELIDWISVLRQAGISSVKVERALPFLGTLLKKEQDVSAFVEVAGSRRYQS